MSNGARNTLSYENAVTLREVTSGTSVALLAVLATISSLLVLHGVNAAHASVGLDQLALARDERSARRLGGTSQEATHHDCGSAQSKTLDDVTDVLNTAISDARNAESSGEAADAVDSSSLRTTNSHNLLGNAGRATTHTNSETINTSSNERSSLLSSDDVSADDIEIRELSLDPLDHLNLVHAVTLRAVEDNDIKTSVNKLVETDLVLRASTNGSGAEKLLAVGELGGKGEVLVLGQIGARDHRDKVEVLVDDGELALLRLGQDLVGLDEGDAVGGGDKVGDHDLGNGLADVLLELKVSVGNDTEELGTELSVLYLQVRLHSLKGMVARNEER